MKQTLYIMCGVAGAGKSTFAREMLEDDTTLWVSRDEIRFSLLSEHDNYHAKEREAWKIFVNTISKYLKLGYSVIADATHLTRRSRARLLNSLSFNRKAVEVCVVYVATSVEMCIERNSQRFDRRHVPTHDVFEMGENLESPLLMEGFDRIIVVDENGDIAYIKERGFNYDSFEG